MGTFVLGFLLGLWLAGSIVAWITMDTPAPSLGVGSSQSRWPEYVACICWPVIVVWALLALIEWRRGRKGIPR